MVYAGNRDGYMYAIEDQGSSGILRWSYPTDGPILFSAAYQNNTIYFASNDSYAYALDARTGERVWKSAKLPSHGDKPFVDEAEDQFTVAAPAYGVPVSVLFHLEE